MPNEDRYHAVMKRCLQKAGWSVIKEHEYISIGSYNNTNRRLYIDLKVIRGDQQLALVEIKSLERSPVHELMELLGQYLIYKLALDYLSIEIPLYVAIPQKSYNDIIQHVLGQEVMSKYDVPLIIFDPIEEVIVKWIPQI